MRLLFFAGLLLAHASGVNAAPIVVRAGEHDGFTRLVFSTNATLPEWNVSRSQVGYLLEFNDPAARIRLDRTFSRIPRTRVLDLRPHSSGEKIDLVLTCDCTADAFVLGNDMLVIDIAERQPARDSEVRWKPGDMTGQHLSFGEIASEPEDPAPPAPGKAGRAERPSAGETPVPPSLPSFLDRRSQVQSARTQLVEHLGRAATQGLLDTALSEQNEAPEDPPAPSTEPDPAPARQAMEKRGEMATNLVARSSVDRDLQGVIQRLNANAQAPECIPDSALNIEDWSDNRPFLVQLSDLRSKLFDDLGKVVLPVATDLTRLYLHFGFGAEARDIITLLSDHNFDQDVLAALAGILDGDVSAAATFTGQSGCPGRVAMWSLLSAAPSDPATLIDGKAVLATFNALPSHLRHHLGPQLSQRFLSLGNTAAADSILEKAQRGNHQTDGYTALANARVAAAENNMERAIKGLTDVAKNADKSTPDALVDLVNLRVADELPIAPEIAASVAALALEHRNGPLGPKLRKALVLSLAHSGQFDPAFPALKDLAERDGTKAARAVGSILFKRLAGEENEVEFLRIALSRTPELSNWADAEAVDAVASRLLSAGFPVHADAALETTVTEVSDRRRLLRADIALLSDQQQIGLSELSGAAGQEADLLRARALLQQQNYSEALRLVRASGRKEDVNRVAFLAESLEDLPADALPEIRALLGLTRSTNQEGEETQSVLIDQSVLEDHTRLLLESQGIRKTILEALSESNDGNRDLDPAFFP